MNRSKVKSKKKYIKLIITICIALIVLSYINTEFFSWGKIKVIVYNNTLSEQTIWLSPEEKYTYNIPSGKKKNIKYSTDDFTISLMLSYYDNEGTLKSIMLSEYVEKHERGKVVVKMKQTELNGEIEFEIIDRIR